MSQVFSFASSRTDMTRSVICAIILLALSQFISQTEQRTMPAPCLNGTHYSSVVYDYLPCKECVSTSHENCGVCCKMTGSTITPYSTEPSTEALATVSPDNTTGPSSTSTSSFSGHIQTGVVITAVFASLLTSLLPD